MRKVLTNMEWNLQRSRRSDADDLSRAPCFVLLPVSEAAIGLCCVGRVGFHHGWEVDHSPADALPQRTYLRPKPVLVGHQACLGHGGGHTTWTCRTCDQTVYGPPLNSHCATLDGRRCGFPTLNPPTGVSKNERIIAMEANRRRVLRLLWSATMGQKHVDRNCAVRMACARGPRDPLRQRSLPRQSALAPH